MPDAFKKQQSWSCWTHLGSSGYHHLNTAIPVILVAAKEPVAGPSSEPAWMGEKLGEFRHWKRPETLGQSKWPALSDYTGSESCPMDVSSRCPHPVSQSLEVRCLIGAEWVVFH